MDRMFGGMGRICEASEKPLIMMIDEVDSASNHQVFLDFLVMLRGYYLGEQFVVEMKIWRGNEYNERGEQQLIGYLYYFHQKKLYAQL